MHIPSPTTYPHSVRSWVGTRKVSSKPAFSLTTYTVLLSWGEYVDWSLSSAQSAWLDIEATFLYPSALGHCAYMVPCTPRNTSYVFDIIELFSFIKAL